MASGGHSPRTEKAALLTEAAGSQTLQELKKRLKTFELDGQKYYVAEGDLAMDEDELAIYALEREALKQQSKAQQRLTALGTGQITSNEVGLLGIKVGGTTLRWAPGVVLRYCVLKNTMTAGEYNVVVANMKAATKAWMNTCGVRFLYVPALDGSPVGSVPPAGVVFTVRKINAGGAFIASAFFPNDPPSRRRVLIDPSYFTTSFDKVGVLRHELGHVVGFRHEHIRSGAPPACPDESTVDTVPLTAYDPKSVMHYFCGGVGTKTLQITALDRTGSRSLYGPPLAAFSFVDENGMVTADEQEAPDATEERAYESAE